MKNTVVPMEFSPSAYALLTAIASHGGHASVEAMIRELVADECRAFAEAVADKADPVLAEILNLPRKEVA